jgi:hypothetical protein
MRHIQLYEAFASGQGGAGEVILLPPVMGKPTALDEEGDPTAPRDFTREINEALTRLKTPLMAAVFCSTFRDVEGEAPEDFTKSLETLCKWIRSDSLLKGKEFPSLTVLPLYFKGHSTNERMCALFKRKGNTIHVYQNSCFLFEPGPDDPILTPKIGSGSHNGVKWSLDQSPDGYYEITPDMKGRCPENMSVFVDAAFRNPLISILSK